MSSAQWPAVAALGTTQTLAWASSYYLPAMLAVPMAHELGLAPTAVFAAFSLALIVSALVGPWAGRAIDRWGGRPVLVATNLVFAAGLALLGLSQGLPVFIAAWVLLGVGMGSGLYEGAFAALVRLYRENARGAITGVTLMAGFASTVGWPLSSLMEANWGWRGACWGWAALHLLVGMPLNWMLPRVGDAAAPEHLAASVASAASVPSGSPSVRTAPLLSFVFAATWFTSTAMAAHLPRLLEASGAPLATAVAMGALIGPAQVGARLLEFGLLRRWHPLLSARLAALAHPVGAAALLAFGAPVAALFTVLHGAGNGVLTIAKGTLPLALFGPHGYGARQGLMMVPARIGQAFAPALFGWLLDRWGVAAVGVSMALGVLTFAALMALSTGTPGHASRDPRG